MKRLFSLILVACAMCGIMQAEPSRPKLVVGLVVDQMRWDFLYRYYDRYTEGGFKRLLSEGYSMENCQISYVPAVTAIGHTSIFTGSVPAIHGIAGNNFYKDGKEVYCTMDESVTPVGSDSKSGKMSPANLLVTTIGDELRLATNSRSKVVGVALKDRASIFPAGHYANAAYWYDTKTGRFITSSFYMQELPEWVNKFNDRHLSEKYLSEKWSPLYDKSTYIQSTPDAKDYECGLVGKEPNTPLPLDVPTLYKKYGYEVLRVIPGGVNITFDMAEAAIEGENLGRGTETDMLTVSCSSTDMLSHLVGVNSLKVEDMYLRLDQRLAQFLSYLDKTVGKGNYLIFLTADHGGVNKDKLLQEYNIPAGKWDGKEAKKYLNEAINAKYENVGEIVKSVVMNQVHFDKERIKSLSLDFSAIKQIVVDRLREDDSVEFACDMDKVCIETIPEVIKSRIVNGYFRGRSGDVQLILKPAYCDYGKRCTTHNAWCGYDSHIPLVFMGWHIQHGESTKQCFVTDIAPTVCSMLHIQSPNGCIGQPLF